MKSGKKGHHKHGQESTKHVSSIIAGLTSGVTNQVLLHPLESLRVRESAHGRGKYAKIGFRNSINQLSDIMQNEGLGSLYRGVTPNIIASGVSWAVWISTYNASKRVFQSINRRNIEKGKISSDSLSTSQLFASGMISGIVSNVVSHPILLLKTRMQLTPTVAHSSHLSNLKEEACECCAEENLFYASTKEGTKRIFSKGISEAYIGISMSLLSAVIHGCLHFAVYDKVKFKYLEKKERKQLRFLESFFISGCCKSSACFVTHPLSVIQTRLQDVQNQYGDIKYKNVFSAIRTMRRTEGLKVFYRGIVPHLTKSFPSGALALSFYELTMKILMSFSHHEHDDDFEEHGCC